MKKLINPKTITIKLSKWRCGSNSKYKLGLGQTLLSNHFGFMCCLGFACRDVGYAGGILGIASPYETGKVIPGITEASYYGERIVNTEFSELAVEINDDSKTTVAEKKKKLKKLGESHGFKFKFIK